MNTKNMVLDILKNRPNRMATYDELLSTVCERRQRDNEGAYKGHLTRAIASLTADGNLDAKRQGTGYLVKLL